MNRLSRAFRVAAGVLSLSLVLGASPVLADPGLTVKGALVESEVVPGRGYTHRFTVVNESDVPMEVLIEPCGFGQALDGAFEALTEDKDVSPYSCRTFFTHIDNTAFLLAPGASQQVTAYIDVPPEPGEGSRYGIIYVYAPNAGGQSMGFVPSLDIPVILTVSDTDTLEVSGEISELTVDPPESPNGHFLVKTDLTNTGNHHFKAYNAVALVDDQGTILAESSYPLTASSIIPMYSYRFDSSLTTGGPLPRATYTIQSEVLRRDGTLLDVEAVTFDYVPDGAGGQILTMRWFIVGGIVLMILLMALLLMMVTRRRRVPAQ